MPDSPDNHSGPALSDAVAERLIARAIELDTERSSRMPATRLREIALEAGISGDAFDLALREYQAGQLRLVRQKAPRPAGRFAVVRGYFRRLGGRLRLPFSWEAVPEAPSFWSLAGFLEAIATNVIAFAVFWVPTVFTLIFFRTIGLLHSGAVDTAAVALGTALGLLLALRLRARVTAVVLAAGLAGELVDLLRAVLASGYHGRLASTGATTMLAGAIGLGLGLLIARRGGRRNAQPPVDQGVVVEQSGIAEAAHDDEWSRRPFLRWRVQPTV